MVLSVDMSRFPYGFTLVLMLEVVVTERDGFLRCVEVHTSPLRIEFFTSRPSLRECKTSGTGDDPESI